MPFNMHKIMTGGDGYWKLASTRDDDFFMWLFLFCLHVLNYFLTLTQLIGILIWESGEISSFRFYFSVCLSATQSVCASVCHIFRNACKEMNTKFLHVQLAWHCAHPIKAIELFSCHAVIFARFHYFIIRPCQILFTDILLLYVCAEQAVSISSFSSIFVSHASHFDKHIMFSTISLNMRCAWTSGERLISLRIQHIS